MKIRILNKNRIDNSGGYDLSNIQSYVIDDGFTITQNYNETLDSAVIRISHLEEEIDIEPFDEVMLYDDSRFSTIYMCVNDYTLTQNSLDGEGGLTTYNYEINLFSQTKELEGIILPNLSITARKGQSDRPSVADFISTYLNTYGRKTRQQQTGQQAGFGNKWHLATTTPTRKGVRDRFKDIEAPELQWNAPTLREVLTDLMMVDDCIPVLNNGIIDYIDLTQTNDTITNYNYIQKSQSADDYVSEIKMNMQNVLQTRLNGINNSVIVSEFIPFASNQFVMTDDNIVIKTKYPILNVKKLVMCYPLGQTDRYSNFDFNKGDLCNIDGYSLVKEAREYGSLKVLPKLPDNWFQNHGDYFSQYQNFCVFYNRGSNEISGFNTLSKRGWIDPSGISATKILETIIAYDVVSLQRPVFDMFYIEYETTSEQTFSASKDDVGNNYRQIVDNQTNAWVDSYTQGNLEYQKANRLGNQQIMINQRCVNTQTPIKLGDVLDKNIVYQVQYQVYSDYIGVNAYATKEYILRDYFTGVNSKIWTAVRAQDEAFERHDLFKYYCEFSFSQHTEIDYNATEDFALYMLSPFNDSDTTPEPLRYAYINVNSKVSDSEGHDIWYPSQTESAFMYHLNSRVIGRSLAFSVGFEDNALAGTYINVDEISLRQDSGSNRFYFYIPSSATINEGGIPLSVYPYATQDNDFEAEEFVVRFGAYSAIDIIFNQSSDTPNNTINGIIERYKLPLVDDDGAIDENCGIVIDEDIVLHKDNKETPTFTFQYEFCSDTQDIYVGKKFATYEKSIRTIAPPTLSVYNGDYARIDKITTQTDITDYATISVERVSDSVAKLKIDLTGILTGNGLFITDGENNVLLAYKQPINQLHTTIYLNILKDRNKNIYKPDGIKLGEI